MQLNFRMIPGVLVLWLVAGSVAACEPAQDGCLGCNDEQLPVCLNKLVDNICESAGPPGSCDARRVYDDAERHVMISTGNQMSRINAMKRSARKYRLR